MSPPIDTLNFEVQAAPSLKGVLQLGCDFIVKHYRADAVFAHVGDPSGKLTAACAKQPSAAIFERGYLEFSMRGVSYGGQDLALPIFISDTKRGALFPSLSAKLQKEQILSYAAIPLSFEQQFVGVFECLYKSEAMKFRREICYDFFQFAQVIGAAIDQFSNKPESAAQAPVKTPEFFETALQAGGIATAIIDQTGSIRQFWGNDRELLGKPLHEILENVDLQAELLSYADQAALLPKIRRLLTQEHAFRECIQIQHLAVQEPRFLLLNCVPLQSASGGVSNWCATLRDVTTEQIYLSESSRAKRHREALIEAARVSCQLLPPQAALHVLKSLVRASTADAGFIVTLDRKQARLNISASEGLSHTYIAVLALALKEVTIIHQVVRDRIAFLIGDLAAEARTANDIIRRGGMRSAVLVPIEIDGTCLGAIALLSKRVGAFSQVELDVAESSAGILALKLRTMEDYLASRIERKPGVSQHRPAAEIAGKMLGPPEG